MQRVGVQAGRVAPAHRHPRAGGRRLQARATGISLGQRLPQPGAQGGRIGGGHACGTGWGGWSSAVGARAVPMRDRHQAHHRHSQQAGGILQWLSAAGGCWQSLNGAVHLCDPVVARSAACAADSVADCVADDVLQSCKGELPRCPHRMPTQRLRAAAKGCGPTINQPFSKAKAGWLFILRFLTFKTPGVARGRVGCCAPVAAGRCRAWPVPRSSPVPGGSAPAPGSMAVLWPQVRRRVAVLAALGAGPARRPGSRWRGRAAALPSGPGRWWREGGGRQNQVGCQQAV